jgi:lipid-binding SYLF domain-containing protein
MTTTHNRTTARLTMPGMIHKSYKVMLKIISPKWIKSDAKIPLRILQNAKGVAFITVVKAGFVWSGTLGSGIVLARLPDGSWSGPSSIGVGGMGWGALIGASVTDSVIILNNDLAVAAFAGHGQIKFGGNLSIAAGPIGREADGSAHAGDGGIAACYSYSHSRGLFAGVSLQGAIMVTRDSDNARFYGHAVRASDVLKGLVDPPDFEDLKRLHDCLNVVRKSKTDSYSYRDDGMTSFRDSGAVSFHAHPQNASSRPNWAAPQNNQRGKYDEDEDDDAEEREADAANARFRGGWNMEEDQDSFANAFSSQVAVRPSAPPPPSSPSYADSALPPGWVQVAADSVQGEPYYWNEGTGVTQWERPAALPPPPPPRSTAAPILPPLPPRTSSLRQHSSSAGPAVPVAALPPALPPRTLASASGSFKRAGAAPPALPPRTFSAQPQAQAAAKPVNPFDAFD